MATAFDGNATRGKQAGFARRISTHLALALILFCVMQIFIVIQMGGSPILHLGIILAIGGFASRARGLERRWVLLDRSGQSREDLTVRFRRDVLELWCVSLFGALLWIPVAIVFRALSG